MYLVNPEAVLDMKIYASHDFGWKICRGREVLQKSDDSAEKLLHRIIMWTLPGYEYLCGMRWTTHRLLKEANAVADLAYISP